MRIILPQNVKMIIERLRSAGHDCYAVGGCVRDCLRGLEPHDWDLTTSATPDETQAIFSDLKTVDIGKRYGTVAVIIDGKPYEITTYRSDGDYSDSRHPDEVIFTGDLGDDLSRRDFTVNAMAYNDEKGLIDCFGGIDDLKNGVIRCVGEPDKRFTEDALRILRALRFASVLGFSIEPETSRAILKLRDRLKEIAPERIQTELLKLLCGDNAGFILRRYRTVIAVFIPELVGTFDFDQNNKHHNRDVYRHIVASVQNIEPDPVLRMTMLLHDIGKPLTETKDRKGVSHYHNHPTVGAAMSAEILKRLRYPAAFTSEVCTLITNHDIRFKPDTVALKRYLSVFGVECMLKLCKIQRADLLAQSMYKREEKLSNNTAVTDELNRITESGECYDLRMLAVNGSDLIHMGVGSGKMIGDILGELLEKVITGELNNDREALLEEAQSILQTKSDD